jgi:hypothetical protein
VSGRAVRCGELRGEQDLAAFDGAHGLEHVLRRVDGVQLRGLEQCVERGSDLCAATGLAAVVVLRPTTGPRIPRSVWLLSSGTRGSRKNWVRRSQLESESRRSPRRWRNAAAANAATSTPATPAGL